MIRKLSLVLCALFLVLSFPFLACSKNKPLKYELPELNGENGVDFCLDFKKGREIRVLQLADLQLTDLYDARSEMRCAQLYFAFYDPACILDRQERVWKYVDEAVERSKPDLLVLTGDNVLGETDDDGSAWLELIEKIDSYEIPWLCIFGNHDNESKKGVDWQIERLKESEYCVFNRGNVSGNSNYNVLIRQDGEEKYLFYMFDTNGCVVREREDMGLTPDNVNFDKIVDSCGLQEDQVQWFDESYAKAKKAYGDVPVLGFMHIAPATVLRSIPEDMKMGEYYDDGTNFGIFKEEHNGVYSPYGFFAIAKENNCKGIFLGHNHEIATSTTYQGVRFTYGLKTGGDSYHDKEMLGSTKIVLKDNGVFDVEYLYSELEYTLE